MDNNLSKKFLNAVAEKNIDLVKALLDNGAKICSCDWAGHTCLHLIGINGDVDMAKFLLTRGANVHANSKFNKTPLHLACQNGFYSIVELLINYGSNVNSIDLLKMTPLHWSIERNHVEIVKFLLKQNNINLALVDKYHRSYLAIASKNKNELLLNIINEKLKQEVIPSVINDVSDEFIQLEKILETSSIKQSIDEEPITCLSDFYKKKSFAKSLTSKSSSISIKNHEHLATNIDYPYFINDTLKPSTSKSFFKDNSFDSDKSSAHYINSNVPIKNWKLILDDEDLSDDDFKLNEDNNKDDFTDDEDIKSTKKKRLSMSPLNKIEDRLNWIKNQSSRSNDNYENKEFSLTEAGKLALDYLNKNDPIRDEKRLFMKMFNEMKNQEQNTSKLSNEEIMDEDDNEVFNLSSSLSNSELEFS